MYLISILVVLQEGQGMAELKYSDDNFDEDFDDFEDESKMKPFTKFLLLIAGIIIIAGLFII